MTIVIILAALAAAYLLLGFVFLEIACRGAKKTPSTVEELKNSIYAQFADEVYGGLQWLQAQERQPLHVVSYDGKLLYGELLACENAKGTLLLFHGYRSAGALDFGISAPFYRSLGYNLLLVDQRAHGRSQGHWITFGVKERYDVQSWVTYLGQMFGEDHPIYLVGLSMGASTVLMASGFDLGGNVRGVCADCGFTSPYAIMQSVLRRDHPKLPGRFVLSALGVAARLFAGFSLHECSTVESVKHTKYPILFVHGKADLFVPFSMSEQAFAACGGEKELVAAEQAGHGQSYLYETQRVQDAIRRFLQKHQS